MPTGDTTGAQKFAVAASGGMTTTGWIYGAANLPTFILQKTNGVETQRWTLAYNASGDVTQITDVTGATSATLSIDASGRPTRMAASNGAVASFAPNLRGQMVQAVTPGGTVTYVYDARNLPVEIRFSDGRWVRYTYSAAHKLVEIADSTGQVERIAGLQPEAFQHERMGQTLALWLRSRGSGGAICSCPRRTRKRRS